MKIITGVMASLLSVGLSSTCLGSIPLAKHGAKGQPTTEAEKISYALGVRMGEDFQGQGVTINIPWFSAGISDGQDNGPLRLSKETLSKSLKDLKTQVLQHRAKQMETLSKQNEAEGKAFLASNGKKSGVKTLSNGLQYRIIDPGKGKPPSLKDRVQVEYTGRHLNGEVFDSTEKQGGPVEFPLTEVILGWQEGLQRMRPGATWDLYIPPKLAYGAQGIGAPIGPNETLIFTIRLLKVKRGDHH